MYKNDFMYAVERNGDYLAHYGVRGMKWGVRRAIASGNSARLGRQYSKAQKKLAKLQKRAANSSKYARRAALMGAGAAAAGGLAAAGTTGVSKGIAKFGGATMKVSKGLGRGLVEAAKVGSRIPGANKVAGKVMGVGYGMQSLGSRGSNMHKGFANVSKAVNDWGNSSSVAKAAASKYGQLAGKYAAPKAGGAYARKMVTDSARGKASSAIGGISNNTIARIGAGVVGAGLAAGAAKNAYRAATAKKKAARFESEMRKAFAGTQYANGGNPRQGKKRRRR